MNLKKMNFNLMTPIQKAVMPYMFKGLDVMGCSQTGSGKTIAFLLPIINKMIKDGPPDSRHHDHAARPVTLILVPTRELADQIYKEARKLIHQTGMNIIKVYGGVSNANQARYDFFNI
jgi:ATP-dependent RNA helicase DDX3X